VSRDNLGFLRFMVCPETLSYTWWHFLDTDRNEHKNFSMVYIVPGLARPFVRCRVQRLLEGDELHPKWTNVMAEGNDFNCERKMSGEVASVPHFGSNDMVLVRRSISRILDSAHANVIK
jgi:hypothetical protein